MFKYLVGVSAITALAFSSVVAAAVAPVEKETALKLYNQFSAKATIVLSPENSKLFPGVISGTTTIPKNSHITIKVRQGEKPAVLSLLVDPTKDKNVSIRVFYPKGGEIGFTSYLQGDDTSYSWNASDGLRHFKICSDAYFHKHQFSCNKSEK